MTLLKGILKIIGEGPMTGAVFRSFILTSILLSDLFL